MPFQKSVSLPNCLYCCDAIQLKLDNLMFNFILDKE